ncbi:hypothetical protein MAPG_10674 [Magnaporthiopsis poae ATCC 64411]|uniref:Uncharacterized protein n=1 Tax=Magnaporthiopsis poae (strain ATCC 64411 / 73-15) TaxID=644358 RepID=A0A0C4ED81_MAGP6|nr:hypothetical protein MAPG_10674 [Magnaporthiopsis poae ATCC 64411]
MLDTSAAMTAQEIPWAPRATTSNSPAEPIWQHAQEKLYPRLVLFGALSPFKAEHSRRNKSDDETCEARRNFLDGFAYLCDVEKGGGTVTAAMLQKLKASNNNVLWLAANEGIRPDVEAYAHALLQKLSNLEFENEREVREDIFRLVIENTRPRLQFYQGAAQRYATRCQVELKKGMLPSQRVPSLRAKLKKISKPPPGMTLGVFVDFCYAMQAEGIPELKKRCKRPDDNFGRLAHYIGRLGATREAVNAVIEGLIKVPTLCRIKESDIQVMPAPEILSVTIDPDLFKPYEIVHEICKESSRKDPLEFSRALHGIVERDNPVSGTLRGDMASSKRFLARVHAELQLADWCSRKGMEFVDGDKYIGCSKPACYFCYNWISNHHKGYVLPATHHKVIVGCRGPDNDINSSGAGVLKKMYDMMCATVGQDILHFLLHSEPGASSQGHQYMSTEGPSRAPSLFPAE